MKPQSHIVDLLNAAKLTHVFHEVEYFVHWTNSIIRGERGYPTSQFV